MSLKDIVNVTISRDTKSVSRAGFSTINILGIHRAFTALITYYSNMTAVLLDFKSTDLEAVAASNIFSQSPTVTRLAISRRPTGDTAVVTVATVADSTLYTVTINGTAFTFTSDGTATNLEIALGLVTAINLGAEPVTATDNVDGTFDLVADVAGVFYTCTVDSNLAVNFTATGTVADNIAAIQQENDDWYALVLTDRTQANVEAAAAYIETVTKIFLTASADLDILNTTDSADTTTIAAVLKAASYARSGVFYHANAATAYPEASLLGVILPLDPGSYTSAFKTLAGITVDTLTDTQKINALAKKVNIYVEVGGVNITREGTVAEGEYIDIIILIDWAQARITEGVFSVLVNAPKVPITDAGIASIEAAITTVIQLGVTRGGFAEGYTVTVPLAANISVADKAARTLNGVTFDAELTGAIHALAIQGTVHF
jgi:hypothetical protein